MRLAIISALLLTTAAPAMAANVFSDGFEAETSGSSTPYNNFINFNVTRGSVDLLRNFGGLSCFASATCVDLGGTGNGDNGRLTSNQSFAFAAGDTVRLSFQLSGNQRPGNDDFDTFGSGFSFAFNQELTSRGYNYSGVDVQLGGGTIGGFTVTQGIFANDPYALRSVFFTAGTAGSLTFNIFSDDGDDFGPILDNVSLDITAGATAVPEPATWGLMLLGFGLAGTALRRRATGAITAA